MNSNPTGLSLLGAAALCAAACSVPAEEPVAAYLVAQAAELQPSAPSLGTIVVVQAKGGAGLRIRTQGGTHTLTTDPDSPPRAASCIPVAGDGSLLFFTVVPDHTECLLYADLLDTGPARQTAPDASAEVANTACPGHVIQHAEVPITNIRTNADPSDAGTDDGKAGGGT